jgi:hypothetical protein
VLTNFVTIPTPPGNASSHLPTPQASTECVNCFGHFSDPNSINMQSSGFVISWTYSQKKGRNAYNAKCRTPSVNSQNCSNPGLVRTSARRYSIYNLVQSSISFYYEDKFVTTCTCNVTFYLTPKLKQTFLFPNIF